MSAPVHPERSPRKRLLGRTFRFEEAWQAASAELGLEMVWNDFHAGPTVRGLIDHHRVTLGLLGNTSKRRKLGARTTYTVGYLAPGAPQFSLTKRFSANARLVDTGNPDFDKQVAVTTNEPAQFRKFMTGPRRHAILSLLKDWPLVEIADNEVTVSTDGAETNVGTLIATVGQLVTFAQDVDQITVDDVSSMTTNVLLADQVRLDERSVLDSLFDSGLDTPLIAARFEQDYRGQQVTWNGEVLNVGTRYGSGKQVAVLIGSADGKNPSSGRVVALTNVAAEKPVNNGDVLCANGTLLDLDPRRRLFRIA